METCNASTWWVIEIVCWYMRRDEVRVPIILLICMEGISIFHNQ